MSHIIEIDLLPFSGTVIDLGSAPCSWNSRRKALEFLDAPYDFYEYIDDVFGYDDSDSSIRSRFMLEFFRLLDSEIERNGFSDRLHFTITMPKQFMAVSFNICFSLDN